MGVTISMPLCNTYGVEKGRRTSAAGRLRSLRSLRISRRLILCNPYQVGHKNRNTLLNTLTNGTLGWSLSWHKKERQTGRPTY